VSIACVWACNRSTSSRPSDKPIPSAKSSTSKTAASPKDLKTRVEHPPVTKTASPTKPKQHEPIPQPAAESPPLLKGPYLQAPTTTSRPSDKPTPSAKSSTSKTAASPKDLKTRVEHPPVAKTASPTKPKQCEPIPQPAAESPPLLKGPYLQAPTTTSMIVAFETSEASVAQVIIWKAGTSCMKMRVPSVRKKLALTKFLLRFLSHPKRFEYTAKITGLSPDTRYGYAVEMNGAVSQHSVFRSAPSPQSPYRVAIFGDNRSNHLRHQVVVDAILRAAPDLVVNTGDAINIGGLFEDWQSFFSIEGRLMRTAPIMPIYGNHEARFYGRAFYTRYWHLPNSYLNRELNYTFIYGNSYWLVIDSNEVPRRARLRWIKARLRDSSSHDFVFVAFHHPLFSFSAHKPSKKLRKKLHPLFVKHRVSAVFNGHNHCYEHFLVDGIHYVVTGGGGARLYSTTRNMNPDESHLRISARRAHHFVSLQAEGATVTATVHDTDQKEIIETFKLKARN
jgi:hypothetical protein